MYSNVKYYCSSEIVQQTIDYGTAVRSSISKRSGGSTVYNMPEAYHQPLASSVGQSCPSLVTDKGIWCPGYPVKYDDTSTYSPSISSGDHTSNEMPSKETMTSNPCSGSVCTFPSKNEKKVQKTARVVALRRMFVRRWDLIKKSTIRRSRNSSVTRKETKTSCKKSVYNEVGTEMDTMINAATITSSLAKSRHFNLLRDTAAATSGLSVKKRKGLCVATSISDVKHLLPAPTVYHAGTQITRSPFSNKGKFHRKQRKLSFWKWRISIPIQKYKKFRKFFHVKTWKFWKLSDGGGASVGIGPLTRRGVSFNGGSTEVTSQRSSSLRPKVDCTVMAGTNTPGQPPFRPTQLSRGVESRKSTLHNRPLFRPSKWADIVVNKIIKNIRSNSRKKLTTESRATTMTPVTTCSFSNDTRSMLSYFMPNDELGIISSKCSRDCNTSNFCNMETDNYSLPFCPSDLAEKLAEKIIIHITKKPTGYKLIGWPTDECCADVATECGIYQLGAQHPSHSSVRALKSESPRSSESLKLYKCTIPEEDTDCEKLQSDPETPENNSHSTSDDMNKNTVVEKDTECHSSHSSEQAPKSASAELSENSNSSNHSTKLNITVLKNDSNLRRKPFRLPKQAFLSCFTGQPSEDSSIRSKSLPKLKLKSETDPDLINFQPIKLNLWPAYSEGSGIARCRTMLNTGLAEDDFFNIMEQLATQISCEVEKLKACSQRYSDLKRRYYGNKSSWQPTNPSNEFLITITEHEGNNEIVGRFKKETCQIDRNSQAEQVTFKITAMKPKYDVRLQEITNNIKSTYMYFLHY
ncbi:uncharacterized protein LOC133519600 isoform X2 [Cydia pomonella]|uniref:uncharacterized protein LOC133519600 isoform X2 n=1 Tax=Cydia pomonella TaxID=82600 RepID=UPI002ADE4DD5|nr:uncharacterized protein LOC133519600 isoform X2 [Cydia pomonella]